jgi:hypothetical protein
MKFSAMTLANLAVAALLLFTPFLVGLTSSAPYDPWNDLDEDGKISIFDVVKIATTYGTTGDPAKNVTVTNWPSSHYDAQPQYRNLSWSNYDSYEYLPVVCGGFSRMLVYATVDSAVYGTYSVNVSLYAITWAPGGLPAYYEYTPDYLNFTAEISGSGIYVPVQDVDDSHAITVKSSTCILCVYINADVASGWINLRVNPYLRNE